MDPLPTDHHPTPVPAAEIQSGVLTHIFSVLGIVSLAFLAFFIGVFVEGWTDYHSVKEPHIKVEALRNLMLAAGAAGAVIVGTWGLAFAAVRTHALNRQAKVAETDSKFSERKHQAEAFATAIEQLGHDNFAVRLGAVYALEALAKASKSLHGPIFETLCAYVRKEAPAPMDDDLTEKIDARGGENVRKVIHDHLAAIAKPDVVVQAILTVIGRRDPDRDPNDFRLDLQDTNLRKAILQEGHFERALLSRAHFEGARLSGARLEGTRLDEAHLEDAVLEDAHLEDADLFEAHLEGATLFRTHLKGADLSVANLEGAELTGSHLEDANLSGAHLEDVDLFGAHLEDARLRGVSFDTQTRVSYADFRKAKAIPAKADKDFRATVRGSKDAKWPDDDDTDAWDRDKPVVDAG